MEMLKGGTFDTAPGLKDLAEGLEDAKGQEGGEGKEQKAEEPQGGVPDELPADRLAHLEQRLGEVEREAGNTAQELDDIRSALDIPDNGEVTAMEKNLNDVQGKVAEAQEEVAASAEESSTENPLGIPEVPGQNPEWVESAYQDPTNFLKLEKATEAGTIAEQVQEMREGMLKAFIESAVSEMLNGFSDFVDGTENVEQVNEVLEQAIRDELEVRGAAFVESGAGAEELGFSATMERSEFPKPDGDGEGTLKYITDLKLDFDGESVSFGDRETSDGRADESLLAEDEQDLVQAAEDAGVANTVKAKDE